MVEEGQKVPCIIPIRSIRQIEDMREGYFAGDEIWSWLDCLTSDTITPSIDSVVRIGEASEFLSADLKNGKIVESIKLVTGRRSTNSEEELLKISTRTREITASKNHKFFRLPRYTNFYQRNGNNNILKYAKEMRAEELRKGDRVLMAFKLPSPKEQLIGVRTAQLLGYMFGDGTIEVPHRSAVHIDDESVLCLKKYQRLASELGFTTSLHKHNGANCWRLRLFGKKKIMEICHKIKDSIDDGKRTTMFKRIPEIILKSDNEILGAFLRGFFDADGCIIREDGFEHIYHRINIAQKNKAILEEVKMLLLRFGIDSGKIREYKDGKKGHLFYSLNIKDSLSLILFKKYIGFTHPLKKIKLKYGLYKNESKRSTIHKNNSKRHIYGDLEIGMITKIEKIKQKGIELVDVSIPIYENYIANGFVVHNSRVPVSKRNRVVSGILLKSRKRGIDIAYTTQSFHQVDRRIRSITDFLAVPFLNVNESICRIQVYTYPAISPVRQFKFPTAPIFELYNTSEEVEPLEEEVEHEKELAIKRELEKLKERKTMLKVESEIRKLEKLKKEVEEEEKEFAEQKEEVEEEIKEEAGEESIITDDNTAKPDILEEEN